jgi:hypothetical protein
MNSLPSRWSISCWAQVAHRPVKCSSWILPSSPSQRTRPRTDAHLGILLGDRQAALFIGALFVRGPGDFGVHQTIGRASASGSFTQSITKMRDMTPDLRAGKADAGRVIHGFQHVGSSGTNGIRDFGDGLGCLLEARVGMGEDRAQGHARRFRTRLASTQWEAAARPLEMLIRKFTHIFAKMWNILPVISRNTEHSRMMIRLYRTFQPRL